MPATCVHRTMYACLKRLKENPPRTDEPSTRMARWRSVWNAPGRKAFPFCTPCQMKIQLPRGKAMPVRDAAGRTVHAHQGLVRITEESASEDVLLRPGECFRHARPGLAVLEAFRDASISID